MIAVYCNTCHCSPTYLHLLRHYVPTSMQLNTGQVGGLPGHDLNVEPAWIQGITGRGVVVAVVDDGRS